MGVLGLTTFIANDSEKYLKTTILKNCHLVIDGNCLASHLFKWRTKRDSAFGGDYDEYFQVVRNFFNKLKKCRITPIVFMDGGYEERKLPTVFARLKQKIFTLKTTLSNGLTDVKFFPLFMLQVFCEAVESLRIQLIQCEFEADGEIAAVARTLCCPVLSQDSDFYIYDVLYVPFSTMNCDIFEEDDTVGIQCSMYEVDEFLKSFPGLTKQHLPLVAVLLGNDFNSVTIYNHFFQQVPLRNLKKEPLRETRISGLLTWLSSKSVEAAKLKMEEYLDVDDAKVFRKAVDDAKENYASVGKCSVEVMPDGKVKVDPPVFVTPFHKNVSSLLESSKLPPFLVTLVTLRQYLPPLQVESITADSSHFTSLALINAIDRLLCSHTGDPSVLHIYIREKAHLKELTDSGYDVDDDVSYESLISEPLETRRNFILDKLTLSDDDEASLMKMIPESQLFMAAFITWRRQRKLSPYRILVLLLCYTACQAKSRVGYFQVGKDSRLSAEEVSAFVAFFAPYRKTSQTSRDCFSTEAIHEFSCFQSIFYFLSVLNAMLGCPFMPCKITESFSGTLAFNLFASKNRAAVFKDFEEFLKTSSELQEIYSKIVTPLCKCIPPIPASGGDEKRKKKKRKVRRKSINEVVEDVQETGDDLEEREDEDYNDLCNKFNCLSAKDGNKM